MGDEEGVLQMLSREWRRLAAMGLLALASTAGGCTAVSTPDGGDGRDLGSNAPDRFLEVGEDRHCQLGAEQQRAIRSLSHEGREPDTRVERERTRRVGAPAASDDERTECHATDGTRMWTSRSLCDLPRYKSRSHPRG